MLYPPRPDQPNQTNQPTNPSGRLAENFPSTSPVLLWLSLACCLSLPLTLTLSLSLSLSPFFLSSVYSRSLSSLYSVQLPRPTVSLSLSLSLCVSRNLFALSILSSSFSLRPADISHVIVTSPDRDYSHLGASEIRYLALSLSFRSYRTLSPSTRSYSNLDRLPNWPPVDPPRRPSPSPHPRALLSVPPVESLAQSILFRLSRLLFSSSIPSRTGLEAPFFLLSREYCLTVLRYEVALSWERVFAWELRTLSWERNQKAPPLGGQLQPNKLIVKTWAVSRAVICALLILFSVAVAIFLALYTT